MFTGRERELEEMNRLYRKGGFQMVVMYGRRRVGKTTLALEFSKDKPALIYTAKVQSDALNLRDFSRALYAYFGLPASAGAFATWDDALVFLVKAVGDQKLVFIFDEFPYAASKNVSLVSTLQIAIDRLMTSSNIFFILTGSNQGFMEEKVLGAEGTQEGEGGLGEKNPLFGRRTAQIHLGPFGYLDAARMLPGVAPKDLVKYYACFGGTPYYLSLLDLGDSFEENVTRLFFSKEGLLYEEPLLLLRQELREPSTYSSILGAIAAGANTPKLAADRVGIERSAAGKYLDTLVSLRLVEKIVPYGENRKTSRKGIYRLSEPCFDYWYRFVEPNSDVVEQNAGELAAREALDEAELSTYIGHWFERVCLEWVIEQAKQGTLPVRPSRFGSWWGTDPASRSQDDIDIVAGSTLRKEALLGECKWRNKVNAPAALEKLEQRSRLVKGYDSYAFALFTKNEVDAVVRSRYEDGRHLFVDADRLYGAS